MTVVIYSSEPLQFSSITIELFQHEDEAWDRAELLANRIKEQIQGEVRSCPNGMRVTKEFKRMWTAKILSDVKISENKVVQSSVNDIKCPKLIESPLN